MRFSAGKYLGVVCIAMMSLSMSLQPPIAIADEAIEHHVTPQGIGYDVVYPCKHGQCRYEEEGAQAIRTRSQFGIGCLGYPNNDGSVPVRRPPESYLVQDIHKRGFPRLRASELHIIEEIQHFAPSKYLRIAWVEQASTPHNFIVFDAFQGPCEGAPQGYNVLNGSCDEAYQPGEMPYNTHATSGCDKRPRPWMKSRSH